jgi:hypothetical protein
MNSDMPGHAGCRFTPSGTDQASLNFNRRGAGLPNPSSDTTTARPVRPAPNSFARRWGGGFMASSRQADTQHLREAINAFRAEWKNRLDESGLKVLDWLARSDDAGKSVAQLKLKERQQEHQFLFDCIMAERM